MPFMVVCVNESWLGVRQTHNSGKNYSCFMTYALSGLDMCFAHKYADPARNIITAAIIKYTLLWMIYRTSQEINYVCCGLSFDASSEVFGGEELALAVGSGKVKGGSRSVWEERTKRAGPQREQDGGDPFLATTDSFIRQQHRTAF